MNWEALGAIAEFIGGLGVILSLVYLSIQVRVSNRLASAHSRQSMSGFASNIARFRTEHADRYAKISSGEKLSEGDKEFQYWSHMQMMVYGETHFHQFQLKLMPDSHWSGLSNYLRSYIGSDRFEEYWIEEGKSFSHEYSTWISEQLKMKLIQSS